MLNAIWLLMIAAALLAATWGADLQAVDSARQPVFNDEGEPVLRMQHLSNGILASAKVAVQLVIGLTGAMMFFLGLVRVATAGGLLRPIVRALRPLLTRLFPSVPADHPAMGAMVMNFAANMLGLGNAATPFGIKAITELNRLNLRPGSATNAMALFLAINTSSIVLMAPTGTIAVRAAAGSEIATAIWPTTLFATLCSTLVAVGTCLLLQRIPWFRPRSAEAAAGTAPAQSTEEELPPLPGLDGSTTQKPQLWRRVTTWLFAAALVGLFANALYDAPDAGLWLRNQFATYWLLPLLVAGFLAVGFRAGVDAYAEMVAGAKEGLQVAVRIAPFLVAILVAIGMLRNSGLLYAIIDFISPVFSAVGVPAEVLPMALLRPLSGSGAYAVMSETLQTHGPDSPIGLITSTLMGSTETTFYVLAVYLGAVGVRDSRHILPACLAGDVAGFVGAVIACRVMFG